jgi:transposase InsO family protein
VKKEWFTLAEIAASALPELPRGKSALSELAAREGWRYQPGKVRKLDRRGGGFEYHISLLPGAAQVKIAAIHGAPANDDTDAVAEVREKLWARFEALPAKHKGIAEAHLKAVQDFMRMCAEGMSTQVAAAIIAQREGVSVRTVYYWQETVVLHPRTDWLAALAPSYGSVKGWADCHPQIWDCIKSDFLRPEKPSFSACYRRVKAAAEQHGWAPLPSERALRRRLDSEVPEAVQVLARSGKDKAKTLFPAQRRTRDHLHAMEAVNMDGHKFDVFVKMPDGTVTRLYLIALQDLYSGKFVAWRLSDSENKETTRLVIGDMIERYGIPERITLDNGRAFASKWITGGAANRYRFKVRDEDPQGLLTTLGVELQFTKPYSGQSKPIERAFKDLTDDVARHPFCAGAYTGNKPDAKPENYASRAIPLEDFRRHVDSLMAEHNARPGRKGGNCDGRSFDETFSQSMEAPDTIVRQPTAAQRALWLLASEGIKARKGNGEIHIYGNRYWSKELTAYAGKSVIIRFDPEHLTRDLRVYDLNNQLICSAPCIADTGFHDAEAARLHEKARSGYQKAVKAEKDAHAALSAQQLAEIYAKGKPEAPATPTAIRPKVTRIFTGNAAAKVEAVSEEDFENSFGRAMSLLGGADILEFPRGNEPVSTAYGSKKKGGK